MANLLGLVCMAMAMKSSSDPVMAISAMSSGLVLLGILNWNGEDPMRLVLGLLFEVVFGLASGAGLTGLMGGGWRRPVGEGASA